MESKQDPREIQDLLRLAKQASKLAGEIIMPLFEESISFTLKKDQTPVTIADQKAEEAISEFLQRETPNYSILGEELGEVARSNSHKWIIDPIDGTQSFVQNIPLFGTLISLEIDEYPVLGIIACHALGETVSAALGFGTSLNEKPVSVTNKHNLKDAITLTTDPQSLYNRTPKGFTSILKEVKQFRSWGDCYGYLAVACGRADIMIDDIINRWDISAPSIIITEAGGKFSTWNQEHLIGTDTIATNGHLHEQVCSILN